VPSVPTLNGFSGLSVTGALARSAGDLALVMAAIAGDTPRSPLALDAGPEGFVDLGALDLRGLRVAYSLDLGGRCPVDAQVAAVVASIAVALEGAGAHVVEACPDFEGGELAFKVLRAHHFELAYGELWRTHGASMKATLAGNIEAGFRLTGPQISEAELLRSALYDRVVAFFESCDLLLLPTSQVPPFPIELEYPPTIEGVEMASYLDWMASCYLVSLTGMPACSVPGGFTPSGLPVGVQLVGAPRRDRFVLQAAQALDELVGASRVRPPLVA
jgi:amidase